MQLPFGIGITSLVAVAASYDAENQLRQRIRMIASERRYLRMRLRSMGVYSTDGHANFVFLPPWRQPWREVFDGTGLQVRNYARWKRADHRRQPAVDPRCAGRRGTIRNGLRICPVCWPLDAV